MTDTVLAQTPDEIFAVLAERVRTSLVGGVVSVPGGYVKRVKPHEYVLHADANKDRARWGTLSEITDDLKFFITNGVLPKAQGGRW